MTDDNNTLENFDDFDAIVPSPGVPSSHKIYATEKVISELDFLYPSVPSGFSPEEWQAKMARVAAGEESGVCESCES